MQKADKRQKKQPMRRKKQIKAQWLKLKQRIDKMMAVKRTRYIVCTLLCVLAFAVVFRLFLLAFPIKNFEIQGDTHYDINEIINSAEIKTGQRLYGINKSKAEENILSRCPYIKDVKVKAKFPNKICFEIEERIAGWYVQVGEDFYALDYDLKVLLETRNEEYLKKRGLTMLVLPELEDVICGEYPTFGNGDEHLISETLKVIDKIRTHKIKASLTYLNLENRFEIKMTVGEIYHINFGDINDHDAKLNYIADIVSTTMTQYNGGEINVVTSGLYTYKPYYTDESKSTQSENNEQE